MKFMVTWTVPQGTFNAAVARFLETGGAPPEGVKMLGRWHGMNGQGFAISESSDPKAIYRWVAQWSDLLPLTVTPCLRQPFLLVAGPIRHLVAALVFAERLVLFGIRRLGGCQHASSAFSSASRFFMRS